MIGLEMRACVRLTREIFAQRAFDRYRGRELQPGSEVQSDDEIDAFIRAKVESAYHPSCSCKMGAADDAMAVVDPETSVTRHRAAARGGFLHHADRDHGQFERAHHHAGGKSRRPHLGRSLLAPDEAPYYGRRIGSPRSAERERLEGASVNLLGLAIPILFVAIWSTGFIVAKAVLPHADLQLFLVARFSVTALVIGCAALIAGVRMAEPAARGAACVRGRLECRVFISARAIGRLASGMPAGVMALLGSLQPLFTALFTIFVHGQDRGAECRGLDSS